MHDHHGERQVAAGGEGGFEQQRRTVVQQRGRAARRVVPGQGLAKLGDGVDRDAVVAHKETDVDAADVIALFQARRVGHAGIGLDARRQSLERGEIFDLDHAEHVGQQQHFADVLGQARHLVS